MMKKKILCFVLTLMTVVALVPTTLISAAMSAVWAAAEQGLTEETAKLAVYDADGVAVGYYNELKDADAALLDGYTVKFLQDVEIDETYYWGTGRPKFVDMVYAIETASDGTESYHGEGSRYSEIDGHRPIAYTVDGNGYRLISTVENGYAMSFNRECWRDDPTFKNLTIVAAHGGIGTNIESSNKMTVTLENCKVYAGNMYWLVNPDFYEKRPTLGGGDAFSQNYIGIDATIKGAETEFFAYEGFAVWSAGIVSIHDGLFYSVKQTTVKQCTPNASYANEDRHMFIYGGTFVNNSDITALVCDGARMFITGGTFVCDGGQYSLHAGWGNYFGELYVFGGTYYTTSAFLKKETNAGTVIGNATWYHTGTATHNALVATPATEKAETVDAVSIEIPSLYEKSGKKTLTFTKKNTVGIDMTVDEARAAGWQIAIMAPGADESMAPMALMNLTSGAAVLNGAAPQALWSSADKTAGKQSYDNDFINLRKLSYYITPEGGTWRMLCDISHSMNTTDSKGNTVGTNTTKALWHQNQVRFTMDAPIPGGVDIPETLDKNEAAYTFSIVNNGFYFLYSNSAHITLKNINIINPTGRCLEFANTAAMNPSSCTVGAGATVVSGNGSAFYLGSGSTVYLEEGGYIGTVAGYTDWCDLFQINQGAGVYMTGGIMYLPIATANKMADVFSVFGGGWRQARAEKSEKPGLRGVYYHMPLNTTVSVTGGTIITEGDSDTIIDASGHITTRFEGTLVTGYPAAAAGSRITYDPALGTRIEPSPAVEPKAAEGNNPAVKGLVSVLDELKNELATYSTFEEAIANLKSGYTMSLNCDYVPTRTIAIKDYTLKSIIFEGNGHTIGSNSAAPGVGEHLLELCGFDARIEVRNLTIKSTRGGIGIYNNNGQNDVKVILHNVKVEAGSANALYVNEGSNRIYTLITGPESSMSATDATTIYNRGILEIYAGSFSTVNGASVVDTLQSESRTGVDEYNYATAAVFAGTFTGGSASEAVFRIWGGGLLVTTGGSFYNKNKDGRVAVVGQIDNVAGAAATGAGDGFAYILGGTFYHAGTTSAFHYSTDTSKAQARLVLYRGTFHQNGTATYAAYTSTKQYTSLYTPNRETLYSAGPDYYAKVSSVTNSSVSGYSKTWSVSQDTTKANAAGKWEVYNPLTNGTGNTLTFNALEWEAALFAVGDGGEIRLTANSTYTVPSKTVAVANDNKIATATETKSLYAVSGRGHTNKFEYTITSKQDGDDSNAECFKLTASMKDIYMLWTLGGTVNFKHITIENTTGRIMQVRSAEGDHGGSIVNFGQGSTIICGAETAVYVWSGGRVNVGNHNADPKWDSKKPATLTDRSDITYFNDDTAAVIKMTHGVAHVYDGAVIHGQKMDAIGVKNENESKRYSSVYIHGGKVQADNANALHIESKSFVRITGGEIIGVDKTVASAAITAANAIKIGTPASVTTTAELEAARDKERNPYMVIHQADGYLEVDLPEDDKCRLSGGYHLFNLAGSGYMRIINGYFSHYYVMFQVANATSGTLVIENGEYKVTVSGYGVIRESGTNTANVIINNGTFSINGKNGTNLFTLGSSGANGTGTAKWTFNNGTFTQDGNSRLMKVFAAQTVTFNGGDFTCSKNATDIIACEGAACKATLNFNGGTYTANGKRATVGEAYTSGSTTKYYTPEDDRCNVVDINGEGAVVNINTTGGTFVSHVAAIIEVNEGNTLTLNCGGTTSMEMTVPNDTDKTVEETTYKIGTIYQMISDNGKASVDVTFTGGTYTMSNAGATYLYETGNSGNSITISGGSFYSSSTSADAMLSAANSGTMTISGGYFESKALCCVRALGGTTPASGNPNGESPTSTSTARLDISGGFFRLLDGGKSNDHAATVRCAGFSTYATVNISGGVFVNDRSTASHVINQINYSSTVNLTGGTLLTNVANGNTQGFFEYVAGSPNVKGYFGGTSATTALKANIERSARQNTDSTRALINGNFYDKYSLGKSGVNAPILETAGTAIGSTGLVGGMRDGAQVRLVEGSSGLRFVSYFSAEAVAALEAMGHVEYGTLIAPNDLVMKASSFTVEGLDAAGVPYVNLRAKNGLVTGVDNGYYIRAAIVNIKPSNYGRTFTAIGYARVLNAAGDETYYYTTHNYDTNVRSIEYVAQKALEDVQLESDISAIVAGTKDAATLDRPLSFEAERYAFAAYDPATGSAKNGYVSPYNAAQQEILKKYLA